MIRAQSIEREFEPRSRWSGFDRLVNQPGSRIAALYIERRAPRIRAANPLLDDPYFLPGFAGAGAAAFATGAADFASGLLDFFFSSAFFFLAVSRASPIAQSPCERVRDPKVEMSSLSLHTKGTTSLRMTL
jgi:hypothetical protein